MDIKSLLKTTDPVSNLTYHDMLIEGYKYYNIPFPQKIYSIKKSNIENFYKNNINGWARNYEDVHSGIYLISNLVYYHNVRNLWEKMSLHSDSLISKTALDLLNQGFTIIKIEDNEPFKISLSNKLNLLLRFVLSGCGHRDIKTNFLPKTLSKISTIYSELYFFNENLTSNLQLVACGQSPNKSEFPDVYEWHYDLPYPNLKSFYNPENLVEMNGPYSYIPKSNLYTSEKAIILIASALAQFDQKKDAPQNINIVSNFYNIYRTHKYIPSIMEDIRKRERVIFDLPKNHLVITDNFGLHRKTAGFWGMKYTRAYIHPIPYPRANPKFWDI